MKGGSARNVPANGLVAHSANEAATLHLNVDASWYQQLNTAGKGVNIDFLILIDDSLAQVKS